MKWFGNWFFVVCNSFHLSFFLVMSVSKASMAESSFNLHMRRLFSYVNLKVYPHLKAGW